MVSHVRKRKNRKYKSPAWDSSKPKIEEYKQGSFIKVQIFGDKAAVEEGVKEYLRKYPYAGYSTRVTHDPEIFGEGVYRAKVERYHTCE